MFEGLKTDIVFFFVFNFEMTFAKNGQTTTRSRGTRRLKKIEALWAYVTYKELGGIIRLDPSFSDS